MIVSTVFHIFCFLQDGDSALIRFLSILSPWIPSICRRISLMLPACQGCWGFSWVPYIPWWTVFLGSMLSLFGLRVWMPIHPPIHPPVHPFMNSSIHSPTHLPIQPPAHPSIYPSVHPGVPAVCQPSCSLTVPFRDDAAPVRLCFLPVLITRSLIWLHWVGPGVVIFLVISPFQLLCPVVLYWNSHLPSYDRDFKSVFILSFMILITVMKKIHSFTFLIQLLLTP